MLSSAGAYPLALSTARKKPSDDRPPCLENPRPEGAESTLTENAASPFHAEPKHKYFRLYRAHDDLNLLLNSHVSSLFVYLLYAYHFSKEDIEIKSENKN